MHLPLFHNKAMLNRYRQTGAFILVTLVFVMAAGGAMLFAMSNLSSVSNTTTTLIHNGNMALAAAQSGLKYCALVDCPNTPTILAISDSSCVIQVDDGGCNSGICLITSTAYCPSSTDPSRGAKKLSIQVHKTAGGYQMIPASRQVLPLP